MNSERNGEALFSQQNMNEFGSKIQQTRPKTNLTKQAISTLDTGNRDKNVDEKARELPNLQVRKKLSLPFSNGSLVEAQEALSTSNQHELTNYTSKNVDSKQKFFNNLSIPKHYVEK